MIGQMTMRHMNIDKYCDVGRTIRMLALASLLAGCTGSGGPQIAVGQEALVDQGSFSFSINEFKVFSEYRISPGDQLDVLFSIRTWEREDEYIISLEDVISIKFVHAPKLNETQKVRPDGKISLPYLGDYLISGKTTTRVNEELREKYKSVLKNPDIYVQITEYLSQIRELKQDLHTSTRGLSRLVTVRPDGYTTFPMVGDMMVANRTIPEVGMELNQKYQKISSSLYANLFLEKHTGSLIYIIGEVNKPGAYELRKPISLLEAMAIAGSNTNRAQLDSVVVLRRHEDKVVATRVDASSAMELAQNGKMFYLQPDDIVYFPTTAIAEMGDIMAQISNVLLFRGWSIGVGSTLVRDPLLGPKTPRSSTATTTVVPTITPTPTPATP